MKPHCYCKGVNKVGFPGGHPICHDLDAVAHPCFNIGLMPPLVTTCSFPVRFYECDAYAHLNNTVYARYMQETAFAASTAAGFPHDWYVANNRAFVIRSSYLEFVKPVLYGDTVVVNAWVDELRRVQARRRYEMRSAKSGELMCRAHTQWVYVDVAANRPVLMPVEVQQRFGATAIENAEQSAQNSAMLDAPYAPPPPPLQPDLPTRPFAMRRKVIFADIDQQQHVNNAVYLDYCEEAGFAASAMFGWPPERSIAAGWATLFRQVWIEYLQSAVLGDELEITAWLSDLRRVSAYRHFRIARMSDGAEIAHMTAQLAFINLRSGSPARLPAEVLQNFAGHVSA